MRCGWTPHARQAPVMRLNASMPRGSNRNSSARGMTVAPSGIWSTATMLVTRRPPSRMRSTWTINPPRKRLRDLLHDDVATQIGVGVTYHGAQTTQRIPRAVGMHGGHRAWVVGLHRLKHLVSLRPAAFAHDDAIGAPAQR